ncbi:MAG: MATE family efflux transporter [Legionellales bacterium]|nr:MATE family efflux transporter [Legionellales bacterium]
MVGEVMKAKQLPNTWREQYQSVIYLALPILFAHVIEALVPWINTLMAAHISQDALAATGLVNPIFVNFMGFCWGAVTSIGIICAHKVGSERTRQLGTIMKTGLVFSALLSVPVMFIFTQVQPWLLKADQDPVIVALAQAYFNGLLIGVFADIAKFSIFQFAIALNKPRVPLIGNIASIPLLIFFNDALVWGRYGLPELGILGIGLGTAITYWLVFLGMLFYIYRAEPFRTYLQRRFNWQLIGHYLREQFKLGAPIGAMFLIEITFFTVMAIFMGWIGAQALAAHQITMQWMMLTLVIAFGFAEAVIIMVGKASGAKNVHLIKRVMLVGVIFSMGVMIWISLSYWLVPRLFIGVDLDLSAPENQAIILLAIKFLAICGIFQLLDSLRIIISGVLRGLKDTQYPMWIAVISFWVIALPIGYWFAFEFNWYGVGLWWALVIASLASNLMQGLRLWGHIKKQQIS